MAGPVPCGMAAMVNSALTALRGERMDQSQSDDLEDFNTWPLYRRTVNTFSSSRGGVPSRRQRRRGRPSSTVELRVFLLEENGDKVPTKEEQKRLTDKGLGSATQAAVFQRSWNMNEFQEYIYTLFPDVGLQLVGFHLGKAHKSKRLERIDFQSVEALKKAIGRGKLFITPKLKIKGPNNIPHQPVDSDVEYSDSAPMQVLNCNTTSTITSTSSSASDSVSSIAVTSANSSSHNSCINTHPSADSDTYDSISSNMSCNDIPVDNLGYSVGQLRQQQDAEYAASLAADQLKEREKEVKEMYDCYLSKLKEEKKSRVPPDPKTGVLLKVRLTYGSYSRHFSVEDDIQVLMDYIGSMEEATELFDVVLAYGGNREAIHSTARGDLRHYNLTTPTVMFVNWHEPEYSYMKTVTETTEVVPSAETSLRETGTNIETISTTRTQCGVGLGLLSTRTRDNRRQAAVRANQRIRNATRSLLQGSPVTPIIIADEEDELPAFTIGTIGCIRESLRDQDVVEEIESGTDTEKNEDMGATDHTAIQSVTDIVKNHADRILSKEPEHFFRLNLRRSAILSDSFRCLRNGNPTYPLKVRFMGEPGVDDGGLRREFGTLFLHAVAVSSFMEGSNFNHDVVLVKQKKFFHLGQLLSLSLLQGGCGLPVFNKFVTDYILFNDVLLPCCPRGLPEMSDNLTRVLECDKEELEDIDDWLPERHAAGHKIPPYRLQEHDRQDIVYAVIIHNTVQTCKEELDQFKDGLKALDVLTLVQQNPVSFRPFLQKTEKKLTHDELEKILKIQWSEEGTNRIMKERDIMINWYSFLAKIEAEKIVLQFEDILLFVTGSSVLPAEGFPSQPSIIFDHSTTDFCGFSDLHMCLCPYPSSNTCACELKFPVCKRLMSEEESEKIFHEMICSSPGFGQI